MTAIERLLSPSPCTQRRNPKSFVSVTGLAFAGLTACVTDSSGPDSACQRPPEMSAPLDLSQGAQARHLSADAEAAEDIAIRFADGHSRPGSARGHTMAEWVQTRETCMTALFQAIAEKHGVTEQQVRASVNSRRNMSFDVAVMLSFGLLYAFLVSRIARRIWSRFSPIESWVAGSLATFYVSVVVSAIGVIVGGAWAFQAEALRIGYGHLSYRDQRIPWYQHRLGIFIAGVGVFWVLSWLRYQTVRLKTKTAHPH